MALAAVLVEIFHNLSHCSSRHKRRIHIFQQNHQQVGAKERSVALLIERDVPKKWLYGGPGNALVLKMLSKLRTNLPSVLPRTPGFPSLNRTFGAMLIGSYIGFIIYGLNLYQTFHYFKAFPNDRLYLKILVGVVLVLETWHTALCMHTCYHYLVTSYFNPLALLEGCVPINVRKPAKVKFTTLLTFLHTVGVHRCRASPTTIIISLGTYLTIAAPSGSLDHHMPNLLRAPSIPDRRLALEDPHCCCYRVPLGRASTGVIRAGHSFLKPTFAQFEHFTWIISVAFGFSAVADIILTTVLICALRKCRTGIKRYGCFHSSKLARGRVRSSDAERRVQFHSTDSLLDTLIIYAISTGKGHRSGLLTGVFDLLSFIFALIWPNDLIFFGVDIVATKLYPTSLLTALNSRHMLAKQSSGAAAIYGESGIVAESSTPKRSALAAHRFNSWRDTPDREASRSEDIEMNVKANHMYHGTKEVGPQSPVIEIGPLGTASTTRSQSK
ncbi:hypothetical protein NUW54_g1917 [Trametes sanguinea]|uniref:Uncharacterized protein n=1 Tax=Trametes sanguinea TaxID=158606 RepID=A0ACC1Q6B5_9APHY|nr:hypothetical protein NUW54_g1917 [Trametes sanguinea]